MNHKIQNQNDNRNNLVYPGVSLRETSLREVSKAHANKFAFFENHYV